MAFAAYNVRELEDVLERDLGRVVEWVKDNHLRLNTKKVDGVE